MVYNENKPIYLQICDRVMDSITEGRYPVEGKLPSVREQAASAEVNPNTVMRAYDWLQQQRIIYNRRGIGFFVLPEAAKRIREMRKNIFFRDEADYFFRRLAEFGYSPEEVASLYSTYLR